MGLIHVHLNISGSEKGRRSIDRRFLVDSGAVYSVVPKTDLARLKIKSQRKVKFSLATGEEREMEVGNAFFTFRDIVAPSPVIFGEDGGTYLLGAVTLESLGLALDPFNRELRPLPMILAAGFYRK